MKKVQANESQVKMASRLYELRDTAVRLLGERYQPLMRELGASLKKAAQQDGLSALAVATQQCKAHALGGMDVIVIMAAAVELTEPSF
jgi:hypothetical protein